MQTLELWHRNADELLGEMTSEVSSKIKIPKSIQNTRAFGIFTNDINYIKTN